MARTELNKKYRALHSSLFTVWKQIHKDFDISIMRSRELTNQVTKTNKPEEQTIIKIDEIVDVLEEAIRKEEENK